MFEVVKEELGKHFATQSWSDGVDAVIALILSQNRHTMSRKSQNFH